MNPAGRPRPPFRITVDTEGDNLRVAPGAITAANFKHLGRFQSLCDQPTDLARDVLRRDWREPYLTEYPEAVKP